MKIISTLISLYMALLIGYPCSDGATCLEEEHIDEMTSVFHTETSSEGADLCSPFCICNCCRTQMNPPSYFSFNANILEFAITNPLLTTHFFTSFPHAIWQPPRNA